MTKAQKVRMGIDVMMTLVSVILMGGSWFFSTGAVHEILGTALFLLWAIHIALNRKWFASIFRGKYNARRIFQTFVNCAILVCTLLLMISGIMLSAHVFAFLHYEGGIAFARTAHLVSSHWYYLFMALHLGFHANLIAGRMNIEKKNARRALFWLFSALSLYGIYAFASRGVWKYLILQQQFFFLDLDKGYFLFFLDYISILVLFAYLTHFALNRSHPSK